MQAVYNLIIDSPYKIPGFFEVSGKADINISTGKVPQTIESPLEETPFYQISKNEFLINIPNIARYYVCNGSEITIEAYTKATENDIIFFLMDTPFTVLLQQRGILSLRGTALEKDGEAILFVGPAGTGKSTVAEAFIQKGFNLVSDGIIVTDGKFVFPGRNFLSLWKDMAVKAGYDIEKLIKIRSCLERYWVEYKQEFFLNEPLKIKKIFSF